jgi:hypothetical protein
MKGGRKASAWNLFTKKVFEEGRRKDSDYSFKQALKDASNRKGEMNSSSSVSVGTKKSFKKSSGKTKRGGKRRKSSSRRH